jgi:charged multivesicular body protein 2A
MGETLEYFDDILEKIFGKVKTTSEIIKSYEREINKSKITFQRNKNDYDEKIKQTVIKMRNHAKKNEFEYVKHCANNIAIYKKAISKLMKAETQLENILCNLKTSQIDYTIISSIAKITRITSTISNKMDIPTMKKTMMEFEKQKLNLEIKQDIVEDMTRDDETEMDSEKLVEQIMDEAGLDLNGKFKNNIPKEIDNNRNLNELNNKLTELKK